MNGAEGRRVLVLLPVWNGGRWLAAQLDSILAQQGVDVTILCRDDGSTDESSEILRQYRRRFPGQLRIIEDDEGNLGARGSFSRLMQYVLDQEADCDHAQDHAQDQASAIALADQDDIWHPDRLSITLAALREAEQEGLPVLVHSDLRVVDENLEPVAPSLVRYQGLQPWRQSVLSQLLGNPVTGSTTLRSRALLRHALPVPEQAIMHDWWLALVVSLFGRRVYIDRPLVDYRQHGGNAVGARAWRAPRHAGELIARAFDTSNRPVMEALAGQTRVFTARYARNLGVTTRMLSRLVLSLPRWPTPLQKALFRLLRRVG